MAYPAVTHHGAIHGITGSCHQLHVSADHSVLIDCGLFQGEDANRSPRLRIDFPIESIRALLLTHIHLDHVGRIPGLLAAGFRGPIIRTQPTAKLLPLVLEDATRPISNATSATGQALPASVWCFLVIWVLLLPRCCAFRYRRNMPTSLYSGAPMVIVCTMRAVRGSSASSA